MAIESEPVPLLGYVGSTVYIVEIPERGKKGHARGPAARSRGGTSVVTKQKLAQTRAGQTRGRRSRSRRHRPPRKRWEEARGGRRPQPTMEDPSPDDAGRTTGRRSRRAGRDEGGSRMLRRSRVHPSPPGGCLQGFGQKFWSVCSFHLAHCVALAAWPLPEARVALSLARSSAP